MSLDINLYAEHPDKYIELQNLRPDYHAAIEKTVFLSLKYLKNKEKISIADFCGGIGNVTKKISKQTPISKATIIDINKEFLNIAESSGIEAEILEALHSDIIDIKLKKEFDLILLVFAYHHIPDDKKRKYLNIALDGLKENGLLVLTEIYLPNQYITKKYYEKLLEEIPVKNLLLENFLQETADSTEFEFKVAKEFADKELKSLGFREIESIRIWPLDKTFDSNIGTFVQIFTN